MSPRPVARGAALLLASALVLAVAGCGSSDAPPPTTLRTTTTDPTVATPTNLDANNYVAQTLSGRELAPGSTLNLSFNGRQLTAAGGCNTMRGAYELLDGRLRWYQPPAATEMACAKALMDQDAWLADWLVAGVDAKVEGDRLTLRGDGITMGLVEQNSLQDDAPLEGVTWKLRAMGDGDVESSLPANTLPATLRFGEDGSLEIFTSCNRGSTTVEVSEDGTSMEVGRLILTRRACEPGAAEVEAAVIEVLDGSVAIERDGTTLTLTNGDQRLELFATG